MKNYRIRSLKSNNKLLQDYDIRIKLAAENPNMILEDLAKITKEEIKANRKVSSTLRFKGTLRISWAFDIKYNKQIDLIFFPEDNPYINYAVLYAKDFKKTLPKRRIPFSNS